MTEIPLGRHEGDRLEFKQQESLKQPESIGREVVGMLNAEGGEVWVGIVENEGQAVSLDPIPDPVKAQRTLRDHLVDTVEPSPRGEEVSVEIVRDSAGRGVLRVSIRPDQNRKPYALLKGGGRYFHVRFGDRLRLMSRDEIFRGQFPQSQAGDDLSMAIRGLQEERDRRQAEGKDLFWVGIVPVPEGALDIQDRSLWIYLQDPKRTGNRLHGWNFGNPYTEPELRKNRLLHGATVGTKVEILENGKLLLAIPLEGLRHGRSKQEISPYPLIEFPVSLFRLASRLYADYRVGKSGSVVADAALFGISGWTLRPYSPRSLHFHHPLEAPTSYKEGKDLTWERPLVFRRDSVIEEPDWCGFRLVRRIYEAFGYFEDQIPMEFNRDTRRLEIPD